MSATTLQQRLTKNTWTDGEKQMLYVDERYFTFNEAGKLFDRGAIEYIDHETFFLKSDDGWGEVKVQDHGDKGLAMRGTLYTVMGGAKFAVNVQPSDAVLKSPDVDHIVDAALYGDIEAINRLLDAGGDINQTDANGNTALIAASSAWHSLAVEHLLARGADISLKNIEDKDALHWAISANHVKAVSTLLAKGLKPDNTSGELNALVMAGKNHASLEIYRMLLDAGASVDVEAGAIWFGAMVDSSKGAFSPRANFEVVELLLERGININALYAKPRSYYDDGLTPLMMAAAYGFSDMVQLLIKRGADVQQANKVAESAIDVICRDHNKDDEALAAEIKKLLHDAGLTESKEERLKRVATTLEQEIETLALKGEGEQALARLEEGDDILRQAHISRNRLKEIAYRRMKNVKPDQLDKALRLQDWLYDDDNISLEVFTTLTLETYGLLISQSKPGSQTDDKRDKALRIIKKYLEKAETVDEAVLLDSLAHSLQYTDGHKHFDNKASSTNRRAIDMAASIYKQLVELDANCYLAKQIDFYIDTHASYEEAFAALVSLWQQQPAAAPEVEGRLQHAYDEFEESRLPRTPFTELSELHEAAKRLSQADWYYERMTRAAPTNEKYWLRWVAVLSQRGDNEHALQVCDQALSKIENVELLMTKVKLHKASGDIDSAYQGFLTEANSKDFLRQAILPFLEAGADPQLSTYHGDSVLLSLVYGRRLDDMRSITKRISVDGKETPRFAIDIDHINRNGFTTFYLIASAPETGFDKASYLDVLYNANANPNWQAVGGKTALSVLAEAGNVEHVELLLSRYKADPSIVDKQGQTAADLARAQGYDEVVELLERTDW